MADDCVELRALNFKTFRAEEGGGGETQIDGQSWEEFLQDVLADEFQIVRSKVGAPHQKQNKAAMVEWIKTHPRGSVRIHEPEVVSWCSETMGVVTCTVTFNDKDYQNVKVFTKQSQGKWQCVYWQVTQLTPDK